MTVTEAIQTVTALLRRDSASHSAEARILSERERDALIKLLTLADDMTYGRKLR